MTSFWTNALDFANLPAKGFPIGADSFLLADSTTSPAGKPGQALMSNFPVASTISPFNAYQPVFVGAAASDALETMSAGIQNQLVTYQGASMAPGFLCYGMNKTPYQASPNLYAASGYLHPLSSMGSTYNLTAGTLYFMDFIPFMTYAFTTISVYVVTGIAASNITMGIYNLSDLAEPDGAPIVGSTSGSLDSSASAAYVSYTFPTPITLTGGTHYKVSFMGSSSLLVLLAQQAGAINNNGEGGSDYQGVGHFLTGTYNATLPTSPVYNGGLANNVTWPSIFLGG